MNGSIFVDTNVLVYTRDASKLDKQIQAAEWIAHLWKSGRGRLSLQVLAEFYAVVTGKLKPGMETTKAREDVEDLLTWQPLPLTPDLFAEAWLLKDIYHLPWWDLLILAAAKNLQCSFLLSEDFQHERDFQGIRVINPFLVRPIEL